MMRLEYGFYTAKVSQDWVVYFNGLSPPVDWAPEQIIKHPPPTSQSDKKPFLVTGLQWLPHEGEDHDELVVAYLFHGI